MRRLSVGSSTSLMIAGALILGAGSMAGFSACSSGTSVGGELMLAITTDLVPGKDLDRIDVTVEHHGRVQLQESLPLGGGKGLPATIPITALAGDTDPVTVHVVGYLGNTVRIKRDAVTTVPDGRTALLYAPLQYLCDGVPACPGGQTCIAGACAAQAIDLKTLPDYAYDKVFKGPCLDVAACFAGASTALPTASDCKLTEAQGGSDNYALRLPTGSPGTCGAAGCDVPLVQDSLLGWNGQQLPSRVCTLLGSGEAQLVKSTTCPTMTLATPTCQEEPSDGGTADAGTQSVFVSSAPRQPIDFVVAGKNIYYVSNDNAVVELDTTGANAQSVVFLSDVSEEIVGHGLATDGVDVGWTSKHAYVWVAHGGQVIKLLDGPVSGVGNSSIVMDPRQVGVVYYTKDNSFPNTLVRVNSDGTNGVTIASPVKSSRVVAADDTSVFWLDQSVLVAMSPPSASGTQSVLTTVADLSSAFQVVGQTIYWLEVNGAIGTVKSLPTKGGVSPTDVATIPIGAPKVGQLPCAFAVDSTYLYSCDGTANIVRQPLAGGPIFSIAQLPGNLKNGAIVGIRVADGKLYAAVSGGSPGFLIATLPP